MPSRNSWCARRRWVAERFSDAQCTPAATGDDRCPGIDPGPGRCRPFGRGRKSQAVPVQHRVAACASAEATMTGGPPSLRQLPRWKSPCAGVGRPHSSSAGTRQQTVCGSRLPAVSSPATGPSSSARICPAMLRVRRSGGPGSGWPGGQRAPPGRRRGVALRS